MAQKRPVSLPQWRSLRCLTQAAHHESEEIRTLLIATFLQRTAAIIFATGNVMVLAVIAGFRTGGTWSLVWLATDTFLLIPDRPDDISA